MSKQICIINFDDSFVHNIEQLVNELGFDVDVIHYSNFIDQELSFYDKFILGPGPGHVLEYQKIIENFQLITDKKIIGICLGFQIIGVLLGLNLNKLDGPLHGESLYLPNFENHLRLSGLKTQFYNSWYFSEDKVNSQIEEMIFDNGMLVYLKHKNYVGVQFHPESIGSTYSSKIMLNLLEG